MQSQTEVWVQTEVCCRKDEVDVVELLNVAELEVDVAFVVGRDESGSSF